MNMGDQMGYITLRLFLGDRFAEGASWGSCEKRRRIDVQNLA